MPPVHENFEALIRECEPTHDESVPKYITDALNAAQALMYALDKIQQETRPSLMLTQARNKLLSVARQIAVHHATGGNDE